jgi:hypothetical protein
MIPSVMNVGFRPSAWFKAVPFPRKTTSAIPPLSVALSETSAILYPGMERLS